MFRLVEARGLECIHHYTFHNSVLAIVCQRLPGSGALLSEV